MEEIKKKRSIQRQYRLWREEIKNKSDWLNDLDNRCKNGYFKTLEESFMEVDYRIRIEMLTEKMENN